LLSPAQAKPLPDEIRQAVREVAKWDYSQPRKAAYLLEQFTPRATGDAEQRQELAALLAQTAVAADTTPQGRTILCQHLALVAGDKQVPALTKLLDNPATEEDARIALRAIRGFAVGRPAPAEAKEHYLAQATNSNPDVRVAALASLARFYPDDAMPTLIKAIEDDAPIVSATAIERASQLDATALAARLPKLEAAQQVLTLAVLAERNVAEARVAIAELLGSDDESVRLAAIRALGAVGDAGTVPLLAKAAADETRAGKTAAENALGQLAAPGVDEAVLRGITAGSPASRAMMINAAALRSLSAAIPAMFAAARDQDAAVRSAAFKALAKLGDATTYPQLVELLASVQNPALETAVAAVGRRVETAQDRVSPLIAMLKRDGISDETQAAVLRAMALTGGPEALEAVRERVATHDAAVRVLANWPDVEALDDLFKVVEQAKTPTHRVLALRGLLRLAPTSIQPVNSLQRAKPLLKTTAEKRLWLAALSQLKDPAALTLAEEMLTDADVEAEARAAADKINLLLGGKSRYSDAQRAALAKALPAGANLVAYLDCGAEPQDRSGSMRLRVMNGQNWTYHGEDLPAARTVAFSGGQVDFLASGLDPKKCYTLGFTWWDADSNGRAQSVWVGGQQLVEKAALPGGPQGPAVLTRAIPSAATQDGQVLIVFKREAASNCVVSELWLIESAKPLPPTTTGAPEEQPEGTEEKNPPKNSSQSRATSGVPVAAPVVKANAGAAKKVLIVTGNELHNWRETVPLLAAAIGADTRLEVSVVEDPRFLASPELKLYDVFVLNYQNHRVAAPEGALANLKSTVEDGKGLVLVHFACGAFIDWQTRTVAPDFLAIAGRVWNPKFRGHDPHGTFRVKIVDSEHPIMQGLSDFDTEDELYTCLDGDVPIRVLATAVSKVDQKEYPMALLASPGEGRTFHCALGHDARAFGPSVAQLYRRGTAWASGLEPSK